MLNKHEFGQFLVFFVAQFINGGVVIWWCRRGCVNRVGLET